MIKFASLNNCKLKLPCHSEERSDEESSPNVGDSSVEDSFRMTRQLKIIKQLFYFVNSARTSSPIISAFTNFTFNDFPMLFIPRSLTAGIPFPNIFGEINTNRSSNKFSFTKLLKLMV